ncbi:hypothetical protein CYY_000887 [Polysphondylium violaceum]|uniref:FNIP repeat-containing protein n=1 Tax=Polysphondylium violaceum TaxID=133409 RepID=A0A8J4Q310_9MYCE|nr:hypothetical protein CYY_000887 [Polysphondylium violaceum]
MKRDTSWPDRVKSRNPDTKSTTLFSKWKRDNDDEVVKLNVYQDEVFLFKNENIPVDVRGLIFYIGTVYHPTEEDEEEEGDEEEEEKEQPEQQQLYNYDTLKSDFISIVSNLPSHISHLDFIIESDDMGYFLSFLPLYKEKEVAVPTSVTHLSVSGVDLSRDIHIPSSITHLTIDGITEDHNIPSTLQHLYIKGDFSTDVVLPQTITSLQIKKTGHRFSTHRLVCKQFKIKKSYKTYPELRDIYQQFDKLHYPPNYYSKMSSGFYRDQFSYEQQNSPIFDGTVMWLSKEPLKPDYIPIGVKRLFFGPLFNRPIAANCIPDSVEYIEFQGYDRSLSDIHFPSNVKTLILGNQFNQFIYGSDELPKSLTHLEIHIDTYDVFHWIYINGSLPINITHLRIKTTQPFRKRFSLPSSLKFLDIKAESHYWISIMDKEEYYKESLKLPEISTNCGLKHMTIRGDIAHNQKIPLPSSLTSLSFHKWWRRYDRKTTIEPVDPDHNFKSIVPSSLTILKCPNQSYIPLANMFTYLEYTIEPNIKKIVFKNSDKPISGSNLPMSFDVWTSVFSPNLVDKVDELHINEAAYSNDDYHEVRNRVSSYSAVKPNLNINVKKLNLTMIAIPVGYVPLSVTELGLFYARYPYSSPKLHPGSIPNSVKTLTSDCGINENLIPPSVEIFNCYGNLKFNIPPTIKVINLDFNENNLSYLLHQTKRDDTPPPKIINSYDGNNSDSFFVIWRNHYLKDQIMKLNYPSIFIPKDVDQVIEAQNRFINVTLIFENIKLFTKEMFPNNCKNIQGVQINFDNHYGEHQTDLLSILPRGITRLSIIHFKNIKIPTWITHLELVKSNYYYTDLKSLQIPPSVTHLTLLGFKPITKQIINNMVPSAVVCLGLDTAEIEKDSIPSTITSIQIKKCENIFLRCSFEEVIPITVKRISFSTQDFSTVQKFSEFVSSRLDNIEIYDKKKTISPKTKTVIWSENEPIFEGQIPNHISRIIFGKHFDQPIVENSIPNSVKEIYFGEKFSQSLSNVVLPPSITSITLGGYYRKGLNFDMLPSSVKYLAFYDNGIHKIKTIPKTVSHICFFSRNSNTSFPTPSHVEHIKVVDSVKIRPYTDKSFINLSPVVRSIQIEGTIKFIDKIETLEQDEEELIKPFGQDLQVNLVSKSDCKLNDFLKPGSLISNIKSIEFPNYYQQIILPGALPESVTKVNLPLDFTRQFAPPPFLKILHLGHKLNYPIQLPNTIEQLTISKSFSFPIGFFPQNLKIIIFNCEQFEEKFEAGIFPDSVEEIHFHACYPFAFRENTLPRNLKALSCDYYCDLFEFLPKSIQELNFITKTYQEGLYSEISAKDLPPSLTKLTLARKQPIQDLEYLPPTIKYLKLGEYFKGKIPNTVETLKLPFYHKTPLAYIFK